MNVDDIAKDFTESREAKQQLEKEKARQKKAKEKQEIRQKELQQRSSIKQTDVRSVATQALEQLTQFSPTPEQKKVKARFWVAYKENSMVELDQLTVNDVVDLCRDARIAQWWTVPGFASWFRNHLESRERLEYLFNLSLDTMEEILLDPDPKTASAKVNTIKLIAELTSKFPKQTARPVVLDREVSNMTEEDLLKLVGGSLEVRKVIEVPSSSDDTSE